MRQKYSQQDVRHVVHHVVLHAGEMDVHLHAVVDVKVVAVALAKTLQKGDNLM